MGSLRNDELNYKLIAENAAKIELITENRLPYQGTVLRLIRLSLQKHVWTASKARLCSVMVYIFHQIYTDILLSLLARQITVADVMQFV